MREKLIKFAIRLLWSRSVQRLLGNELCRMGVGILKRRILFDYRLTYSSWCKHVEQPRLAQIDVDGSLRYWAKRPLISVVMPTWNTPVELLRAAVESVCNQSYPCWELCIADDASTRKETLALLREIESRDARIKVAYRSENGHISAASNSALALATGDYVAFLDHDDTLAEHALYFVAQAVIEHPDATIIYSDEDKIDGTGHRFDPHFKPEWNPDLLHSINYISHLGVYRRTLINGIGGFRTGVEGSQDYDLLLRCLLHSTDRQIIHIPWVLYHWRVVEGSTALAPGEKSYTTEAGMKALSDYFAAQGQEGLRVEAGKVANTYHVRYPIRSPEPLVSILIPTRDCVDLLKICVDGLLNRTEYRNIEVLILDNQSQEVETTAYFKEVEEQDERVRVLAYDHPFNYSAINNYGVAQAKGEIIALMNNDTEVINPEWLSEMVAHVLRPEIGCVGAKLYYDDDTIQHAGVVLGMGGVAGHVHKDFPRSSPGYFSRLICVQNLSAVTGACLLVRREIYEQVGGLNERDLPVAFNDVDFCLRVSELGLRNLWTPYAELYHHESKSRGWDATPEKIERFKREVAYMTMRWPDRLHNDDYYHKSSPLEPDGFGLK